MRRLFETNKHSDMKGLSKFIFNVFTRYQIVSFVFGMVIYIGTIILNTNIYILYIHIFIYIYI